MMDGAILPSVRINISRQILMGGNLVETPRIARRVHNTGIVPAIRKHKGHVGLGSGVDLVD